jgi:hypothetical protein
MLSADEISHLQTYSQMFVQPSGSSAIIMLDSPPPPSDNDTAPEGPDPALPDNNVPSHCNSYLQQPEHSNSYGGNSVTGGGEVLDSI